MTIEELRQELMDYVGTASFSGMPAAFIDLAQIENADAYELIRIARQLGFEVNII